MDIFFLIASLTTITVPLISDTHHFHHPFLHLCLLLSLATMICPEVISGSNQSQSLITFLYIFFLFTSSSTFLISMFSQLINKLFLLFFITIIAPYGLIWSQLISKVLLKGIRLSFRKSNEFSFSPIVLSDNPHSPLIGRSLSSVVYFFLSLTAHLLSVTASSNFIRVIFIFILRKFISLVNMVKVKTDIKIKESILSSVPVYPEANFRVLFKFLVQYFKKHPDDFSSLNSKIF